MVKRFVSFPSDNSSQHDLFAKMFALFLSKRNTNGKNKNKITLRRAHPGGGVDGCNQAYWGRVTCYINRKTNNIPNDLSLFSNVSTIKWVLRLNKKRDLKLNDGVGQRQSTGWNCRTRWKTIYWVQAGSKELPGEREWEREKKKAQTKNIHDIFGVVRSKSSLESYRYIVNMVCTKASNQRCETGRK